MLHQLCLLYIIVTRAPNTTVVCYTILSVHAHTHTHTQCTHACTPAHTHTISKKIGHLHPNARVAGTEGTSILNHIMLRSALPSNPKMLMSPLSLEETKSLPPSSSLKTHPISCFKMNAFFFFFFKKLSAYHMRLWENHAHSEVWVRQWHGSPFPVSHNRTSQGRSWQRDAMTGHYDKSTRLV